MRVGPQNKAHPKNCTQELHVYKENKPPSHSKVLNRPYTAKTSVYNHKNYQDLAKLTLRWFIERTTINKVSTENLRIYTSDVLG